MKNRYKKNTKIFPIISLLVFLFGINSCRNENSTNPDDNQIIEQLIPYGSVIFQLNDIGLRIDSHGQILQDRLSFGSKGWSGTIFNSGLWFGAYQNGEARTNTVGVGDAPRTNYTTVWGDSSVGVFYVNDQVIANSKDDWPVGYGAPVDQSDEPVIYGDEMCWSALNSDSTSVSPLLNKPIKNLRVTEAVFEYQSGFENSFFIRYEFKNIGSEAINEMYCGYWADLDLLFSSPESDLVGYDSANGITYTYSRDIDPTTSTFQLMGYTFLQTPEENGNEVGITSHRIMTKGGSNPMYGEDNFTQQSIINALMGLTNTGNSMVNPVTQKETKFAFTGDPIAQTGWLDNMRDGRSLISSGPFSLEPGESKVLTAVFVTEMEENLEDAITKLKSDVIDIRANSDLWKF